MPARSLDPQTATSDTSHLTAYKTGSSRLPKASSTSQLPADEPGPMPKKGKNKKAAAEPEVEIDPDLKDRCSR